MKNFSLIYSWSRGFLKREGFVSLFTILYREKGKEHLPFRHSRYPETKSKKALGDNYADHAQYTCELFVLWPFAYWIKFELKPGLGRKIGRRERSQLEEVWGCKRPDIERSKGVSFFVIWWITESQPLCNTIYSWFTL